MCQHLVLFGNLDTIFGNGAPVKQNCNTCTSYNNHTNVPKTVWPGYRIWLTLLRVTTNPIARNCPQSIVPPMEGNSFFKSRTTSLSCSSVRLPIGSSSIPYSRRLLYNIVVDETPKMSAICVHENPNERRYCS